MARAQFRGETRCNGRSSKVCLLDSRQQQHEAIGVLLSVLTVLGPTRAGELTCASAEITVLKEI